MQKVSVTVTNARYPKFMARAFDRGFFYDTMEHTRSAVTIHYAVENARETLDDMILQRVVKPTEDETEIFE